MNSKPLASYIAIGIVGVMLGVVLGVYLLAPAFRSMPYRTTTGNPKADATRQAAFARVEKQYDDIQRIRREGPTLPQDEELVKHMGFILAGEIELYFNAQRHERWLQGSPPPPR